MSVHDLLVGTVVYDMEELCMMSSRDKVHDIPDLLLLVQVSGEAQKIQDSGALNLQTEFNI